MKITFLDIASIGNDLDLSPISEQGEISLFQKTEPEEIAERIAESDIIIINKIKITAAILEKAPKLKLICVAATGFDNIDLEACRKSGVAVCNVPAYSTNSVALVTVSLALALQAHLKEYSAFAENGDYTKAGQPNRFSPVFNDLFGKTWGIIGYGNIGRKIAEIAKAFGCRVLFNKNTPTDEEGYTDVDTLLRESDIITLNCPLNDKTRNLINAERLEKMKKTAVLVNTARGAVLDENAVTEAVLSGKIGAFGCDVYSTEPFGKDHPYNKIKSLPQVCLTPHMAWASFEARTKVINEIAGNIRAFFNEEIRNRVEI